MKMYRINWREVTGKEGHGKPVFETFDEAQRVADELNRKSVDIQPQHWVELVLESSRDSKVKNETRDILAALKDKTINYVIEHTGRNRKERRRLEAEEHKGRGGPARVKPKGWAKGRKKRRRVQKEKRKQSWR